MAGGDTTIDSYQWEVVDENWSRCSKTGLWLFISGKWLYEYDQGTNSLTPLKAYVSNECKLPDSSSADLKVKCAAATMQGRRPAQEDRAIICADLGAFSDTNECNAGNHYTLVHERSIKSKYEESCPRLCALVCDGHAGAQAADYVVEALPLKTAELLNQAYQNLDLLKGESKKVCSAVHKRKTNEQVGGATEEGCEDTFVQGDESEILASVPNKKIKLDESATGASASAYSISNEPHEDGRGVYEDSNGVQSNVLINDDRSSGGDVSPVMAAGGGSSLSLNEIRDEKLNEELKEPITEGEKSNDDDIIPRDRDEKEELEVVISEIKKSLRSAFEVVDRNFLKEFRTARDGCTATIACVLGRHLFVAGCGDTRAVLASSGNGVAGEDEALNWTAGGWVGSGRTVISVGAGLGSG